MKNYSVGVLIILVATVIIITGENFDREPLYPRDCLLPAHSGTYLADASTEPRYFWYKDLGTCLEFQHFGVGGNPNTFKSLSACMYTCETDSDIRPDDVIVKAHVHKCMYDKKDPGPCTKRLTRWFYNVKSSRCEKFIYGGCKGSTMSRNNFRSKEECEQKCMVREQAGPDGYNSNNTYMAKKRTCPFHGK